MSEHEEAQVRQRHLSELFSALKHVVADNPRLQEMIRMQEQDNRQVLLNMSSVLRMVEQEHEAALSGEPAAEPYRPKVVQGWMMHDEQGNAVAGTSGKVQTDIEEQEADDPQAEGGKRGNFFDRAFLKSLKISL
ncbi:MAG: hypothetical protein OEY97_01860 [Nitrospirota bacterium]|nr:hypothetical protein [Nitrospirota bacterium]